MGHLRITESARQKRISLLFHLNSNIWISFASNTDYIIKEMSQKRFSCLLFVYLLNIIEFNGECRGQAIAYFSMKTVIMAHLYNIKVTITQNSFFFSTIFLVIYAYFSIVSYFTIRSSMTGFSLTHFKRIFSPSNPFIKNNSFRTISTSLILCHIKIIIDLVQFIH